MKKIIFAYLLFACFQVKGQQVTPHYLDSVVNLKFDSLKLTLDSLVVIDKTVNGSQIVTVTIDTLSVPVNTLGLFVITYAYDDPAHHYIGHGEKLACIANWNGVYVIPDITDPVPPINSGFPSGPIYIRVVNGLPVMQLGNFGLITKWRFWIDMKIKPL